MSGINLKELSSDVLQANTSLFLRNLDASIKLARMGLIQNVFDGIKEELKSSSMNPNNKKETDCLVAKLNILADSKQEELQELVNNYENPNIPKIYDLSMKVSTDIAATLLNKCDYEVLSRYSIPPSILTAVFFEWNEFNTPIVNDFDEKVWWMHQQMKKYENSPYYEVNQKSPEHIDFVLLYDLLSSYLKTGSFIPNASSVWSYPISEDGPKTEEFKAELEKRFGTHHLRDIEEGFFSMTTLETWCSGVIQAQVKKRFDEWMKNASLMKDASWAERFYVQKHLDVSSLSLEEVRNFYENTPNENEKPIVAALVLQHFWIEIASPKTTKEEKQELLDFLTNHIKSHLDVDFFLNEAAKTWFSMYSGSGRATFITVSDIKNQTHLVCERLLISSLENKAAPTRLTPRF